MDAVLKGPNRRGLDSSDLEEIKVQKMPRNTSITGFIVTTTLMTNPYVKITSNISVQCTRHGWREIEVRYGGGSRATEVNEDVV